MRTPKPAIDTAPTLPPNFLAQPANRDSSLSSRRTCALCPFSRAECAGDPRLPRCVDLLLAIRRTNSHFDLPEKHCLAAWRQRSSHDPLLPGQARLTSFEPVGRERAHRTAYDAASRFSPSGNTGKGVPQPIRPLFKISLADSFFKMTLPLLCGVRPHPHGGARCHNGSPVAPLGQWPAWRRSRSTSCCRYPRGAGGQRDDTNAHRAARRRANRAHRCAVHSVAIDYPMRPSASSTEGGASKDL
jgi:hypothetical protein